MLRYLILLACLLFVCGFAADDDAVAPVDTTDDTIKRFTEGDSRASGHVTIHAKPAAGQYWETGSDSDGIASTVRWQVTSIQGDLALVEQRITVKAELFHSDYVLAYRLNLKAEAGKGNVTAAWIGKPDKAPTRVKVREGNPPAAAGEDGEGEEFSGLELAGGIWQGKLFTREFDDLTVRLWIAEGGWFNSIVKTTAGDYVEVLKRYGGDGDPVMLWPKQETWHTDD